MPRSEGKSDSGLSRIGRCTCTIPVDKSRSYLPELTGKDDNHQIQAKISKMVGFSFNVARL